MAKINIDPVILGFFIKKPQHGYEVYKELSNPEGIGSVYRLKIGKLYSILNRLEKNGTLQVTVKSDSKRPPKNEYQITLVGRTEFENWMAAPLERGRDFRVLFLCKLYFMNKMHEFSLDEIISLQVQECDKWLSKLEEKDTIKGNFEWIVDEYRKSQIQSLINWLKWCKRNLE